MTKLELTPQQAEILKNLQTDPFYLRKLNGSKKGSIYISPQKIQTIKNLILAGHSQNTIRLKAHCRADSVKKVRDMIESGEWPECQ